MSEYKIEKGIPAPPARTGRGRPREYPFPDMEVGDSFFAANKLMEQVAKAVSYARRNTGYQFSMRSLNEDGVEGVRVWRTE